MLSKTCVRLSVLFLFCGTFFFEGVANATPIEEIATCQAKHKKDKKRYLRCLDALNNQFEREMTTWENSVLYKLEEASKTSGRGEAIAGFKKSIKHFQNYRKVNCQWHYMAFLPDVMMASARLKECQVDMSKDRITKLSQLSEMEFY
jgi:uncharacterized protein YecT (DUF1311 family)